MIGGLSQVQSSMLVGDLGTGSLVDGHQKGVTEVFIGVYCMV